MFRHKVFYSIGFFTLTIFSFLYSKQLLANSTHFYATTCLGGWENTLNASGESQITPQERNESEKFTQENSAILNGSQSQIFCGGFEGEVPEGSAPEKILVRFSWTTKDVLSFIEVESNATTTIITDDFASSTVEIIEIPEGQPSEVILVPDEHVSLPDELQEMPLGEIPVDANPALDSSEPVSESVPAASSLEEPLEPSAAESFPVSILHFFTSLAYADEQPVEVEVSGETSTTTTEDMSQQHGVVEVLYTLDGTLWHSLGTVAGHEFAQAQFEIPIEHITEWQDISHIQISVQSLPVIDAVAPIIFLDAVWLEAEYASRAEVLVSELGDSHTVASAVIASPSVTASVEVMPEVDLSSNDESEHVEEHSEEDAVFDIVPEDVLLESSVMMDSDLPPVPKITPWILERKIVVDREAVHECAVENFRLNITADGTGIGRIAVRKDGDAVYEIEVGSLPEGIDAVFATNKSHSYNPGVDEQVVELEVTQKSEAVRGDFSVPIVYTKKGNSDSSVVCQINIIHD